MDHQGPPTAETHRGRQPDPWRRRPRGPLHTGQSDPRSRGGRLLGSDLRCCPAATPGLRAPLPPRTPLLWMRGPGFTRRARHTRRPRRGARGDGAGRAGARPPRGGSGLNQRAPYGGVCPWPEHTVGATRCGRGSGSGHRCPTRSRPRACAVRRDPEPPGLQVFVPEEEVPPLGASEAPGGASEGQV